MESYNVLNKLYKFCSDIHTYSRDINYFQRHTVGHYREKFFPTAFQIN